MPSRSPTADQIADLQRDAAVADQRLKSREKDFDRHELSADEHELPALRERVARYEEKVDKLVRDRDESSRWKTQLGLLATGAALTLAVQLLSRWLGK